MVITEQKPAGDVNKVWYAISISGDKMLAGVDGGRLYYFDGTSWEEVRPAGDIDKNWYSVSISGDKMLAGVYNGRLYHLDVTPPSSNTTNFFPFF